MCVCVCVCVYNTFKGPVADELTEDADSAFISVLLIWLLCFLSRSLLTACMASVHSRLENDVIIIIT